MKPISDSVFIDTNILVYSYSTSEIDKRDIARNLISEKIGVISTQVLQELTNILTKKMGRSYTDASSVVVECVQNCTLYINTDLTLIQACEIADKYKFSLYDSLIIAAALASNCSILYSEDLQHGQTINQSLFIKNPFLKE